MYIDSHCHITHSHIKDLGSPEEIVKIANNNNIVGMTTICCQIEQEFEKILKIIKPLQNVWCSVGTHPHDASDPFEKLYTVDDIIKLANSDLKVIGIGESGLDYFYDHADRNDQANSFRKHIHVCMATGLPLIVHAREADQDCIDIIKEELKNNSKPLTGVLHCFSSGEKMAMEALDLDFYISFSGMLTFKNMQWLRDIASNIPLDKVLIETDAPFLAPVPFRGKINQPSYVEYTALQLAKIHNLTREEVAATTFENFFNLFPKALKTWVNPDEQINAKAF